jgi:hypothetical protein
LVTQAYWFPFDLPQAANDDTPSRSAALVRKIRSAAILLCAARVPLYGLRCAPDDFAGWAT